MDLRKKNRHYQPIPIEIYKILLGLKQSMSNIMIYGELGITPQNLSIQVRILDFAARRINGKHNKTSVFLYKLMNFIRETCISHHGVLMSSLP